MRRTAAVLICACAALVQVSLGAEDLVYTRFGDYLDSLRVQTGIPGLSAAIVGKSGVLWSGAFGNQNLERSIATRTDTPMHVDGVTEAFTATLVLRCVEEGRLSLEDPIGRFKPSSPDANLTLRQVLTHTSGPADNLSYAYHPERLEYLSLAIRACTGDSYRETLANILNRTAMIDSVPGPDVIGLAPPAEGILTDDVARFSRILDRLAVGYAVDAQKHASPAPYTATTLTPTSGLISTVLDLAQFDLALKGGYLLTADTLASAWRSPVTAGGQRLPHGIGWFVQTYNGETVVWQYGTEENSSSSLIVILPARSLTMILLANSNGLSKSFQLSSGDITTSPFARLFLSTFVR